MILNNLSKITRTNTQIQGMNKTIRNLANRFKKGFKEGYKKDTFNNSRFIGRVWGVGWVIFANIDYATYVKTNGNRVGNPMNQNIMVFYSVVTNIWWPINLCCKLHAKAHLDPKSMW